jgi:predicted enzyme related to lactoylglutathione lyase
MLNNAKVQPMLPVKDLGGAKKFYEETLGLQKVGEMGDEAVTFKSGGTTLVVYRSEFAGTNKGTAALWEVDDVDGTVKQLKSKGVKFEQYDMPGLKREGDFYRAEEGGGFKVAWFKDPAGNILSVQNREGGDH